MCSRGSCHYYRSVEVQRLIKAIQVIRAGQTDVISHAKTDLENFSTSDFISSKVSKCFKMADIYSNAFLMVHVKNLSDFEHMMSHCFCNSKVREGYDDLLDNERKFDDRFVKVVIVSFGVMEGAKQWKKDAQCPFDMVIDRDRKIYNAFGLYRSVAKVWNFGYMAFYGELILTGRTLPKPYEHITDDPIQMGGDFIMDGTGVVTMAYPSQTPTDRPSLSDLIDAISGTSLDPTGSDL